MTAFAVHDRVDEHLRREWHDLAERVGTRFASRPSYGLAWHTHLARGPLRVATVRRGGRLVALLGLHRRRRLGVPVLRLLGHGLGTVGEALADDDGALADLVDGLACSGAVLELTHLPLDSPLAAAVGAHPRWRTTLTRDDHCPVIELPPGTRAADLRSRSTLSRAASTRRKLAREGRELVTETVRTPDQFDHRWPEIVRTAAAAGTDEAEHRLNLCAPPHDAFTHEFLRHEAENGHLLLWGATFGGDWGAHFATLATGSRAELWFTRFHPAYRRIRPGHHLIETVCDQHDDLGITEVDLLIGRSGYKADWQTHEYAVGTLVATPVGRPDARWQMTAVDRGVDVLRRAGTSARTTPDRARDALARFRSRRSSSTGDGAS